MKQRKSVRMFFLALVLLGVSLTHRSGLKGEEMEITKAIIPAAGKGTRFLPYTKAFAKEGLPLCDKGVLKPGIQWTVEECIASGITNLSIVTSRSKQAIENHFDASPDLELFLKERNKLELIASTEKILHSTNFTYVRQPEQLGLGHAVWMARHTIGKEYFCVLLPDEIFISKNPGLAQLIRIARQERASVVAVMEVPIDCVSSYGIVGIKKQITPKLFQISHLVEKPDQKDSPSNLALIGRYVLSHKVFDSLEQISDYTEGELQLTDGINHMLKNGEKVFAYKVQGVRYDIGNPVGWVKAIIGTALQDPRFAPHIREFLADLDTPNSFLYNNSKNITHTTDNK